IASMSVSLSIGSPLRPPSRTRRSVSLRPIMPAAPVMRTCTFPLRFRSCRPTLGRHTFGSSPRIRCRALRSVSLPLPPSLKGRLALPAVAAPMFLVSGPDLVVEACRAGVIGTFPALNQRTSESFEAWLGETEARLAKAEQAGEAPAPYGVNLIVHRSNPRVDADLKLIVKHKVPLVITSLGAVSELVDAVHSYGGLVFHDVINIRHAEKAAGAGVDGLIAVCAGAGGHAGTLSPFALDRKSTRLNSSHVKISYAVFCLKKK